MTTKQIFRQSKVDLEQRIANYFKFIEGEYYVVNAPSKIKGSTDITEHKVWLREQEPATISGLALYLGFESRQAFDTYELTGKHGQVLKRGRLKIEAEYEKKLHFQSSAGAMFALKAFGWNDKSDNIPILNDTIRVEILVTGATESGWDINGRKTLSVRSKKGISHYSTNTGYRYECYDETAVSWLWFRKAETIGYQDLELIPANVPNLLAHLRAYDWTTGFYVPVSGDEVAYQGTELWDEPNGYWYKCNRNNKWARIKNF